MAFLAAPYAVLILLFNIMFFMLKVYTCCLQGIKSLSYMIAPCGWPCGACGVIV